MICRLVPAKWNKEARPFEGEYDLDTLLNFNSTGYHIYFFPNYPSAESYARIPVNPNSPKKRKKPISGEFVDTFEYVFIDLDMKHYKDGTKESHDYETKEQFIETLFVAGLEPTRINDSGGGIHAYWRVKDLDAKGFLRLNRRLCRRFNTDEAVSTLNQLMRLPNTVNIKDPDNYKLCETVFENNENIYDCETLDKFLPPIRLEDETYCEAHYDKTYNHNDLVSGISEELPVKFLRLVKSNPEVKSIFYEPQKDRSHADYRLGHLLYAGGLTADEGRVVLMQTSKASERTKTHRYTYANNIVGKIWRDATAEEQEEFKLMSKPVSEILKQSANSCDKNTRLPCHPLIDATEHGFRLSEVLGLIGGQGNSKTTFCLNMFQWFAERSPNYIHLYVSLEQPAAEVAAKWAKMTLGQEALHESVHILDNYNEDGTYRDLSIIEIQDYALKLEKHIGSKIGCLVVDHIGILRQEKTKSEFDGLTGVCKRLKSVAIATNTFMVIQSQTTRGKNGGGDMELDLDAAFGSSSFESYCDYIMTIHQPLKRIYNRAPHMTVTAFKFPKIRHKDVLKDKIKADVIYCLMFDPKTDKLREMTSDEYKAYDFWAQQANVLRNKDRKQEPNSISVIDWIPKK